MATRSQKMTDGSEDLTWTLKFFPQKKLPLEIWLL